MNRTDPQEVLEYTLFMWNKKMNEQGELMKSLLPGTPEFREAFRLWRFYYFKTLDVDNKLEILLERKLEDAD